jgi:uncharacterized protein (DUF2336 family)
VSDETPKETALLGEEDLKKLREDASPQARTDVADKVSKLYAGLAGDETLTDTQMELAEHIFRVLIRDVEAQVRTILSENLRFCTSLPHEVVIAMAKDIDAVAVPMLEASVVLTDRDLIDIIKTTDSLTCHLSIARRKHVSEAVSEALVKTRQEKVVQTVLENPGAKISKETYDIVVKEFADHPTMIESLVASTSFTQEIMQRVLEHVSDEFKRRIQKKYDGDAGDIERVVDRTKEIAGIRMANRDISDQELRHIMKAVEEVDGLKPVPMLCMGSVDAFYAIISRKANIPLSNIKKVINEKSDVAFTTILQKAGIPETLLDAVREVSYALLSIRTEALNRHHSMKAFAALYEKTILERVEDKEVEGLHYLIGLIWHYATGDAPNAPTE